MALGADNFIDITPVLMYPLSEGISVASLFMKPWKPEYIHYRMGALANEYSWLPDTLEALTSPVTLDRRINSVLSVAAADQMARFKALYLTDYGSRRDRGDASLEWGLVNNNPALRDFSSTEASSDSYRHQYLSMLMAQIRTLKYWNPEAYAEYLRGMENYQSIELDEGTRQIIDDLLDLYKETLTGKTSYGDFLPRRITMSEAFFERTKGLPVEGYLRQWGAIRQYSRIFDQNGTLLSVLRYEKYLMPVEGAERLQLSSQGLLIGDLGKGCCNALAIMAANTLDVSGVFGLRYLLQGLNAKDPMLTRPLRASAHLGNVTTAYVYHTLADMFSHFDADSAAARVFYVQGHALMLGRVADHYIFYDPNYGLYRYATRAAAMMAVANLISRRYDYFGQDALGRSGNFSGTTPMSMGRCRAPRPI